MLHMYAFSDYNQEDLCKNTDMEPCEHTEAELNNRRHNLHFGEKRQEKE